LYRAPPLRQQAVVHKILDFGLSTARFFPPLVRFCDLYKECSLVLSSQFRFSCLLVLNPRFLGSSPGSELPLEKHAVDVLSQIHEYSPPCHRLKCPQTGGWHLKTVMSLVLLTSVTAPVGVLDVPAEESVRKRRSWAVPCSFRVGEFPGHRPLSRCNSPNGIEVLFGPLLYLKPRHFLLTLRHAVPNPDLVFQPSGFSGREGAPTMTHPPPTVSTPLRCGKGISIFGDIFTTLLSLPFNSDSSLIEVPLDPEAAVPSFFSLFTSPFLDDFCFLTVWSPFSFRSPRVFLASSIPPPFSVLLAGPFYLGLACPVRVPPRGAWPGFFQCRILL